MDFGFTEDQRQIQRTARELLADRARPERVREHAEAGTVDRALWHELCELGWPGIAVAEDNGGFNLRYLTFTRPEAPYGGTPAAVIGDHLSSRSR